MGFINKFGETLINMIAGKPRTQNSIANSNATDPASEEMRVPVDLESFEGIARIPVKKFECQPNDGETYAYYSIEYVLQRKATQHKKRGDLDLAIECLRKANEIMLLDGDGMVYSQKDYLRLAQYLKLANKFEEAREVEERYAFLPDEQANEFHTRQLERAKIIGTDLVEVTTITPERCCTECYKNQNRIFSLSGNDKRFPKMPKYLLEGECCGLNYYPFTYGVNYMNGDAGQEIKDVIGHSNRPFVDDRTDEQKQAYEDYIKEKKQEIIDRKDYDFLVEHLPEIAPKSFGGYRRMRGAKTTNFMKLVDEAMKSGYEIQK